MTRINGCIPGLYEKALPGDMTWDERLNAAKNAGYDFPEISIDETDEKLERVRWTPEQRDELVAAMRRQRLPILTMCLSGNRRFPIGSEDEDVRRAGIRLIRDAVDFSLDVGMSMGRDPERDFKSGRGHIVAIHLKDTLPGKTRGIPYGHGTVDFIRFFKMLKRMRYRGLLVRRCGRRTINRLPSNMWHRRGIF